MAVAIKKINPGHGSQQCVWELPVQLPAESRIEIHDTVDPEFPYEARLITVQECSEQDRRTRSLFVTVVIENHTRNQDFELVLGGGRGGLCEVSKASKGERTVGNTCRVNRALTDRITIEKYVGFDASFPVLGRQNSSSPPQPPLRRPEDPLFSNSFKSTLCKVAAVFLVISAVAFILYLRAVIPADYVWPGISKLLVAWLPMGLTLIGIGLLERSGQYERRSC